MKKIINKVKMFFAGEKGGETAEWAVIVGLLVIIGTTVYSPTGTIGNAISSVGGKITTAISG